MRRQLNLMALAISSMVVLAFTIPLAILIRNQTEDRALAGAQRDAQSIATAFAVAAGATEADLASLAGAIIDSLDASGRVSILLDDNTIVGAPFEIEDSQVIAARNGNAFVASFEHGAEVLIPVSLGQGSQPVVRSFVPTAELRKGVVGSWVFLATLGLILVTSSVLLADRLGKSIVGPVQRVSEATRRFGLGRHDIRLPIEGPPEVAEVALEFNHLADHLQQLLRAERESVADLSHRLRTPLAALRLQAEALPKEAAACITPEVERMEQAVTQLIELARQAEKPGPSTIADLAATVRHRSEFWRVLAKDQGRDLTVEVPTGPIVVPLREDELGVAIDTLVENVFAHTPPGTPLRIRVAAGGRETMLVVEDRGPGFDSPTAKARGASGSGSTGLGLDIVRQCVSQTGGNLTLENRPGGGARVTAHFGVVDLGDLGRITSTS